MKNLKRITIILFISIVLSGVGGCEDYNPIRCLQTVQEAYPDAIEIKQVPDKNYWFMVNTGAQIRLVTIKHSWKKITTDTIYMNLAVPLN